MIEHDPVRTEPDVSVIIPTWKAGAFVGAAVESALASRDVAVEVVVVDDASPDDTFSVVSQLAEADPRVRVDRLEVNGGPSAARNRAIELSTGRFIAVLDADDTMEPDRLGRLCGIAETAGADIVVDNVLEVDEAGNAIGAGRLLSSPEFSVDREISLLDWASNNRTMTSGICIGYLKPLMRRETLDRLDVRYDPTLRNSEDYYLIAHLLARGASMIYSPEPGYRYRRAAGSTSSRLYPRDTRSWLDAERRFIAEFAHRFSPAETAEFRLRGKILRDVHQWAQAYDAIKSKRLASLTRIFAADPAASAFTLTWFARAGLRKLAKTARISG